MFLSDYYIIRIKCVNSLCYLFISHVSDEASFKNLIVWIEDQKIRHYKIEDREALRKVASPEWNAALNQVL